MEGGGGAYLANFPPKTAEKLMIGTFVAKYTTSIILEMSSLEMCANFWYNFSRAVLMAALTIDVQNPLKWNF